MFKKITTLFVTMMAVLTLSVSTASANQMVDQWVDTEWTVEGISINVPNPNSNTKIGRIDATVAVLGDPGVGPNTTRVIIGFMVHMHDRGNGVYGNSVNRVVYGEIDNATGIITYITNDGGSIETGTIVPGSNDTINLHINGTDSAVMTLVN